MAQRESLLLQVPVALIQDTFSHQIACRNLSDTHGARTRSLQRLWRDFFWSHQVWCILVLISLRYHSPTEAWPVVAAELDLYMQWIKTFAELQLSLIKQDCTQNSHWLEHGQNVTHHFQQIQAVAKCWLDKPLSWFFTATARSYQSIKLWEWLDKPRKIKQGVCPKKLTIEA